MIRFGMALMEIIEQLTKGFIKATGRQPDNLEKLKIQQEAVQRFKDMNKVVDMEGNVIDTSKGIMGGKQIQDSPEFGKKIKETYDAAKGPGKGQEMVDALKSPGAQKTQAIMEDQLGMKLYGDETFEEILEIQKTGKHPRGEPKAQGGRAGFSKGKIVKEGIEKLIELFKKEKTKPKGDKIYGVGGEEIDVADFKKSLGLDEATQKKDMEDLEKKLQMIIGRDRTKHTTGGRAGFKDGMSRRSFLKIMGGLAALPIVGKFFKAGKVAAPAVEAAKETVTQAPSYFFDLVSKIKIFGKQRQTPSYKDRVNEYTYTGKDGIEYDLIEDLDTGEIKITKDKLGGRNYGDESYEVIEDRTEMVFKKGQVDETTKGKKPPDEYEEYKVEFDQDGTAADASEIDELSKSEIIKEVSGDAPSIKKAGGGIARMLGE